MAYRLVSTHCAPGPGDPVSNMTLQAAETRNRFVGYRNLVCRARDSAKILRWRLLRHRQKIHICRWGDASPILPLDPPLITDIQPVCVYCLLEIHREVWENI